MERKDNDVTEGERTKEKGYGKRREME